MRHRRDLLRGGLVLGAAIGSGGLLTACASAGNPEPTPRSSEDTVTPSASNRTLLVYFSRPGENYYYGGRRDLEVGNTEVLARLITGLIDCDVHRLEAAEPYPDAYDDAVARNSREQDEDARPGIANPLDTIEQYDTVLVGSPIWNVRTPMIMTTFAEAHDFTGKTVQPFVTYAVSGLGRAVPDYTAACPGASIGPGLALQGEEVAERRTEVQTWLRDIGLG